MSKPLQSSASLDVVGGEEAGGDGLFSLGFFAGVGGNGLSSVSIVMLM